MTRLLHPADTGRFDFDVVADATLIEQLEGMQRLHVEAIRAYGDRLADEEMRQRLNATVAHWESWLERQERRLKMHETLRDVTKRARAELTRLRDENEKLRRKPPFSYHDIRLGQTYFGRRVVAIEGSMLPDAKSWLRPLDTDKKSDRAVLRYAYADTVYDSTSRLHTGRDITSDTGLIMYPCSTRRFADWVRTQMKKESA